MNLKTNPKMTQTSKSADGAFNAAIVSMSKGMAGMTAPSHFHLTILEVQLVQQGKEQT